MCKKGNQCNRTLCFFAHSASELRFPDTEDEVEAAAVDAAAASATAGPLPMCHPGTASGSLPSHPGLVVMQSVNGSSNSSLPLMHIGSVCSDASAATAAMADNSSSSYSMAALQAAAGSLRQSSCASQLTGLVDDMSGSYGMGGSDPGLFLSGIAAQQQQQQQQPPQLPQGGTSSLSEPLPRLGSDPNNFSTAAWLQLATASQLPASQILSSIRPPNAASFAAQQAQQQLQQQRQAMMQSMTLSGLQGVHNPPTQLGGLGHASQGSNTPLHSNVVLMSGGSGTSTHPLVHSQNMDSSAEQLVATLSGLQLQGGLVDDRSGSSGIAPASAAALADRYAAFSAAAAAGRPVDTSMLHGPLNTAAASGQGAGSSRAEDFMLLQMLQEKQVQQQQQQQLTRLSSGGGTLGARQNMPAAHGYTGTAVTVPQQTQKLGWGFGMGI